MGDNAAYSYMEATVMGAYNLGVLDKKLLAVLLEPYRDTDIDSGGSADLQAKDGTGGVKDVVIKVWFGEAVKRPDLPKDYRKWTPQQDEANEAYHEALYEKFRQVTKNFGW